MGLKENIKSKRLELNMTLEELANKVGISRQTIQRYESGVISNIPSDKIEKLAEALECSTAFLMGWDQKDQLNEKDKKSIKQLKTNIKYLKKCNKALEDMLN